MRSGLEYVDFCTTLYDTDQNDLKNSHFLYHQLFFTAGIIVTSMLELYLGSAFLALHFKLLAQLLLVFMLDIGMLSV